MSVSGQNVFWAVSAIALLAACSNSGAADSATNAEIADSAASTDELASTVWKAADAETTNFDGGDFHLYFNGDTYAARELLTGVAELKPGQELHPPHQHADEEFLIVTEGSGVWTVGDQDFPAEAGDLLYAAPWDNHGIRANPDTPLKFYVIKYHGKGVAEAPPPEGISLE
jgi:quercetin dioxygenase-like cupin family protein